jgi:hypothetical protein
MAQANHSLGTKNNSPSSLCRLKSSIQAVIEVVLAVRECSLYGGAKINIKEDFAP